MPKKYRSLDSGEAGRPLLEVSFAGVFVSLLYGRCDAYATDFVHGSGATIGQPGALSREMKLPAVSENTSGGNRDLEAELENPAQRGGWRVSAHPVSRLIQVRSDRCRGCSLVGGATGNFSVQDAKLAFGRTMEAMEPFAKPLDMEST